MPGKTRSSPPKVGVVVPVYNEEEVVVRFHEQLRQVIDTLPYQFMVYYVNDGSSDQTADCLEQVVRADPRARVIELSRNFGHQAALTAGLDVAEGDYVITMDGDGEHPPAMIAEMLLLAESGYDIVRTQRTDVRYGSAFKQWSSAAFYRLINRVGDTYIWPGSSDFRLLARPVVEALRGMREYHRFLRGMVAWVGYHTVILPYQPAKRLAASSKYSLAKMMRLAMNAVFSFSLVPMYLGISLGLLFLLLALAEVIYVLNFWIRGDTAHLAPGWSSLMFVLLIVGGITMVLQGVIGIYVGYTFQEIKKRPLYLVRREIKAEQAGAEDRPG